MIISTAFKFITAAGLGICAEAVSLFATKSCTYLISHYIVSTHPPSLKNERFPFHHHRLMVPISFCICIMLLLLLSLLAPIHLGEPPLSIHSTVANTTVADNPSLLDGQMTTPCDLKSDNSTSLKNFDNGIPSRSITVVSYDTAIISKTLCISFWPNMVNQRNVDSDWMSDANCIAGNLNIQPLADTTERLEYCQCYWEGTVSWCLLPADETITFYQSNTYPHVITSYIFQCV